LGGGASFWLKVSMIREGGPCPFWITPWNLTYNWGKAWKPQGSPLDTTRCPYLAIFEGQPQLSCWASHHHVYPWGTSVSPRSAQVPSRLPNKGFPPLVNFDLKLSVSALM
jgi:hypothetical protein